VNPQATHLRRFVPKDIDLSDWAQIEPLIDTLLARPVNSPAELERWLADFSETYAAVDEAGARKYIAKSCHTEDMTIEAAFLHHVERVEPRFKQAVFELQKKYIASPHRSALTGTRYEMLNRNWQAEVDLFRPENVELETQVTKLVNEYDKIFGAMMVEFRGQQYTPQFMSRFMKDPDRATRKEAFDATTQARLVHRETIDNLFDQVIELRQQIAKNAGFENYRDYAFKMHKRFDYGPAECDAYADTIERAALPVIRQLEAQRRGDLGLDVLRPWDLDVDPQNRPPLRPFEPADIKGFVEKTHAIFERLSPDLAQDFNALKPGTHLDLDSRKGKQPGGYQSALEESREPFIFMNATGLQSDVRTLLHEGGHAFHYQWASAKEPLVFLRSAPIEFCEVASMSMELLSMEHFDLFYGEGEDYRRSRREQLETVVQGLTWIATIDQFQQWLYTHPGHTRDERTAHWNTLVKRFGSDVDWAGCETVRDARWQAQLHLFHVPFYYIEYGIAQLGALQLWLKSQQDLHQALANYRAALSLGGTQTLPKLFATAGITFDFSLKTVGPLMDVVRKHLSGTGN
jgi:oligoendopeptidase F